MFKEGDIMPATFRLINHALGNALDGPRQAFIRQEADKLGIAPIQCLRGISHASKVPVIEEGFDGDFSQISSLLTILLRAGLQGFILYCTNAEDAMALGTFHQQSIPFAVVRIDASRLEWQTSEAKRLRDLQVANKRDLIRF